MLSDRTHLRASGFLLFWVLEQTLITGNRSSVSLERYRTFECTPGFRHKEVVAAPDTLSQNVFGEKARGADGRASLDPPECLAVRHPGHGGGPGSVTFVVTQPQNKVG